MAGRTDSSPFASEAVTSEEVTGNATVETPAVRPLMLKNREFHRHKRPGTKKPEMRSRYVTLLLINTVRSMVRRSFHDTKTQSQHTTNPPFFDFVDSVPPFVTKTRVCKCGGTGQVSQATIHPSYKEVDSKSTDNCLDKAQEHLYALKDFHVGNVDDFFREVMSHQRLTQTPHPHIVPLLASYREKSQYHLVFPWADCDLAMFWRRHPRPPHDKRTLEWIGRQMMGLADALSIVHGPTEENEISSFYGVHGDLKPENILCFHDAPEQYTLAITDFGSSYFLPSHEKKNTKPRHIKRTPAYRAPEVDITSEGVTQAYDIWGFGCIISQALLWALDGLQGLERLSEARHDQEDNSPNRDAFFRLQRTLGGVLTARLKPQVQNVSFEAS